MQGNDGAQRARVPQCTGRKWPRKPDSDPGSALLSVVNLAAVTNQEHKHGHFPVIDAVDGPVIPDADSLAVGCSSQLATARMPRIVSQRFDCFIKARLELGSAEPQQEPCGGFLQLNCVTQASCSSPDSFAAAFA